MFLHCDSGDVDAADPWRPTRAFWNQARRINFCWLNAIWLQFRQRSLEAFVPVQLL